MPGNPTKESVESACRIFLDMGIGPNGDGAVVIRSAAMGACIGLRGSPCTWVEAFWSGQDSTDKVVDVTGTTPRYANPAESLADMIAGAGNSFLGGLGAGLVLSNGDIREGMSTPACTGPVLTRMHHSNPVRNHLSLVYDRTGRLTTTLTSCGE